MKKTRIDHFNTQTNAIEQDKSNQLAIKRLRLITDSHQNDQLQFNLNLNSFTDLKLDITSSRINLPSVLNEIFELVNQFFSSLQQSTESIDKFLTYYYYYYFYLNLFKLVKIFFLRFLVLKLEFLMNKIQTNTLTEFKLESIAKLLLQLLVKYFEPIKLREYYSKFFNYLKQTSKKLNSFFNYLKYFKYLTNIESNKLIVELLSIWSVTFVDDPIDLNEIKEELLPYLKRVLNFLIFFFDK